MQTKKILKEYFGYDSFRDGQEDIINDILNNKDVLGIMPTGAGKSLCFWVPSLIMDGITLVVSPLISLMQDQVKSLIEAGIPAAYINSSLTSRQISLALSYAKNYKYKIIYIAPERLLTSEFLDFAQSVNISQITIDEAHCISQWGQDFRPSYTDIPEFISLLSKRPVVSAFTATATEKVKDDILSLLKLNNPLVLITGFNRENLYFSVKQSQNKTQDLLHFLHNKKDLSGIIYCSTRKAVEAVYQELLNKGYLVSKYHAGLPQFERQKNQNDFLFDNIKIMVATNAFGMGIDKSNVRYVVHYNMPKDLESYYQEAGRAGRDSLNSECIMLYSPQDVITQKFLIENGRDVFYDNEEQEKELKDRDYKRLKEMTFYSTTNNCLRNYILKYFGENTDGYCGNCSNCNTNFETIDVTNEAKKIISCILSVNSKFGKGTIVDILKGSKNAKIIGFNFDKLPLYNSVSHSINRLRNIIDYLIFNEYIMQTDTQYPTLYLGKKAEEILKNNQTITMKIAKEKEKIEKSRSNSSSAIPIGKEDLFEALRELRAKFAKGQGVPAFVIFTDATLIDICYKMPTNLLEFRQISGVGQSKLEKYGEKFIQLINEYI